MIPGLAELIVPEPAPRPRPPIGSAWYVVHTHPNLEATAEKGIKAIGFSAFLPIERRWAVHARRKIERTYPLFGPYLFVSFDRQRDEWESIADVRGVESILGAGMEPGRVRSEDIDAIRMAQKLGFFDATLGTKLAGRNVRILNEGALELVGKILSVGVDRRADVVMSLLGRENVVRVPLSRLRPA